MWPTHEHRHCNERPDVAAQGADAQSIKRAPLLVVQADVSTCAATSIVACHRQFLYGVLGVRER